MYCRSRDMMLITPTYSGGGTKVSCPKECSVIEQEDPCLDSLMCDVYLEKSIPRL